MFVVTGKRGVYIRRIISIECIKMSEEIWGYLVVYEEPYKKIYQRKIPRDCIESVRIKPTEGRTKKTITA